MGREIMDARNIAYYVNDRNPLYGYQSGSWGERVIEALISPFPKTIKPMQERLRLLTGIYQVSDTNHSGDLDGTFGPTVRQVLTRLYHGELSEDDAIAQLYRTLQFLPILLFLAFPDVQQAVLSYVNSDDFEG